MALKKGDVVKPTPALLQKGLWQLRAKDKGVVTTSQERNARGTCKVRWVHNGQEVTVSTHYLDPTGKSIYR